MIKKLKSGVQYLDVDDVVVKIISDGKWSSGFVAVTGAPYPPVKALVNGREISRQKATKLLISEWGKTEDEADQLLR